MRTIAVFSLVLLLALGGAALAQSRERPICGSLEACDAAIRTDPSLAAYEQRGFLRLMQRRGLADIEQAIADFSAAIALDPARAFSLYGRGMARLMSGDAAGQNEMEAAIMLQADIAEEFKRHETR